MNQEGEVLIPELNENGVEVVDGDAGEPSPDSAQFLENFSGWMAQMSSDCREQLQQAYAASDMNRLSDTCKLEFSQAARQTSGGRELHDQKLRQQADLNRANLPPPAHPHTKVYLIVSLVFVVGSVIIYIIWANKKMAEAGLRGQKRKPLSKKKLEKQQQKEQQRKKVQ